MLFINVGLGICHPETHTPLWKGGQAITVDRLAYLCKEFGIDSAHCRFAHDYESARAAGATINYTLSK